MRRFALLAVLGLIGAVLPATPAAAAPPVQIATNASQPWVFVDRQGITHVVRDVDSAGASRTFSTRAAPGATAFEAPRELPVGPGTDFAGPT